MRAAVAERLVDFQAAEHGALLVAARAGLLVAGHGASLAAAALLATEASLVEVVYTGAATTEDITHTDTDTDFIPPTDIPTTGTGTGTDTPPAAPTMHTETGSRSLVTRIPTDSSN